MNRESFIITRHQLYFADRGLTVPRLVPNFITVSEKITQEHFNCRGRSETRLFPPPFTLFKALSLRL